MSIDAVVTTILVVVVLSAVGIIAAAYSLVQKPSRKPPDVHLPKLLLLKQKKDAWK